VQLTIHYFAQVRQAAGVESEQLALDDGVDVPAVLTELAARHGDDFRALVLDPQGGVRPSLVTLVNGVPAPHGKGQALSDGDEISLLSAIAGG